MALTINIQPSGLQFSKSPLLVKMTSTNASQDEFKYILEVKIYKGTSAPTDATYTLNKLPNTSISNSAIFNIGKLVEAEIEHKTPNSMTANEVSLGTGVVWVNVVAKAEWHGSGSETTAGNTFSATRGYTLMQSESVNHDNYLDVNRLALTRPSNTTVHFGFDFYVPIVREFHDRMLITYGSSTHTITPTANINSSYHRIVMVNVTQVLSGLSHQDDFSLKLSDGTNETAVYNFTAGCENKYAVVPVMYINRYGIWETLFMSKKKVRTNTITSVEYQRPHFIDDNTIDFSRRGMTTYNPQTKVAFTLNSDFLDEEENRMYLDLYRSEYICIYVNGKWKHVTIDNKQFKEKTHLNDKVISHSITFTQGYTDENLIL